MPQGNKKRTRKKCQASTGGKDRKSSDDSPETKKQCIPDKDMNTTHSSYTSTSATCSLLSTAELVGSSDNVINSDMLVSLQSRTLDDVYTKLDAMSAMIVAINSKLDKLDSIDMRLKKLEGNFQENLARLVAVEQTNIEFEKSLQYTSDTVESLRTDVDQMLKNFRDIQASRQGADERSRLEVSKLSEKYDSLSEELLDVQTRSMRDNLLFYNIKEIGGQEDCKQKIQMLCQQSLGITDAIEIDRAHRIGKSVRDKTRPIVAKFRSSDQREMVRRSSHLLRGSGVSVSEQFPKPVQERRRALVPVMKKAKQEGKKAVLVKDKLYIEGVLYKLPK